MNNFVSKCVYLIIDMEILALIECTRVTNIKLGLCYLCPGSKAFTRKCHPWFTMHFTHEFDSVMLVLIQIWA